MSLLKKTDFNETSRLNSTKLFKKVIFFTLFKNTSLLTTISNSQINFFLIPRHKVGGDYRNALRPSVCLSICLTEPAFETYGL